MPSREEFWDLKRRRIQYTLGISIPMFAGFGWLALGLPVFGAIVGVLAGLQVGYFTRVVRPSR
jgi:ABC-type microcin C transport system permease subunit YejE